MSRQPRRRGAGVRQPIRPPRRSWWQRLRDPQRGGSLGHAGGQLCRVGDARLRTWCTSTSRTGPGAGRGELPVYRVWERFTTARKRLGFQTQWWSGGEPHLGAKVRPSGQVVRRVSRATGSIRQGAALRDGEPRPQRRLTASSWSRPSTATPAVRTTDLVGGSSQRPGGQRLHHHSPGRPSLRTWGRSQQQPDHAPGRGRRAVRRWTSATVTTCCSSLAPGKCRRPGDKRQGRRPPTAEPGRPRVRSLAVCRWRQATEITIETSLDSGAKGESAPDPVHPRPFFSRRRQPVASSI